MMPNSAFNLCFKRYALLAACVAIAFVRSVWAEAVSSAAGQENQGEANGLSRIARYLSFDAQIVPLWTCQLPERWRLNPGNDVLGIESQSFEVSFRPNVHLALWQLDCGIKPRWSPIAKYWQYGDKAGETDFSFDSLFVNEANVTWNFLPSANVSYRRKALLWGPAFLASPSNIFYSENGKTMPAREIAGKDFMAASWTPADWVSINGYANLGEGAYSNVHDTGTFQRAYAVSTEFSTERISVCPVISYREGDRMYMGAHGKVTASEALIVYGDGVVSRGSNGRYVAEDSRNPLGYSFQEPYSNSSLWFSQILAGFSYTFLNGICASAEYYYNSPGYSDRQNERYRNLIDTAASAKAYSGSNYQLERLALLGKSSLGQAHQTGLSFLRRNYVMVYANHNNLFEIIDATAGYIQNMDDASYYLFCSLSIDLTNSIQLISNSLMFCSNLSGNHGLGEFNNPLRYCQLAGFRFYF
jgi:hypothetical protein